jgi:succinate-acetate transporter protein
VRGTNNGFGVVAGGFSDSFSASANRTYYRMWNTAVTLSYTRTTNPPGLGLTGYALNTLVPAIQFSRAITRDVSTYGSYTAQHQSADSAAPGAFRGLFQIVAFGVTYAPRSITFGDR